MRNKIIHMYDTLQMIHTKQEAREKTKELSNDGITFIEARITFVLKTMGISITINSI